MTILKNWKRKRPEREHGWDKRIFSLENPNEFRSGFLNEAINAYAAPATYLRPLNNTFQSRGVVKVCCCFSRIACRWMLAAGTASAPSESKDGFPAYSSARAVPGGRLRLLPTLHLIHPTYCSFFLWQLVFCPSSVFFYKVIKSLQDDRSSVFPFHPFNP